MVYPETKKNEEPLKKPDIHVTPHRFKGSGF